MVKEPQTTNYLRKAGVVSDAEIDAATDAFLADPKTGQHALGGSGYSLDLAGAVKGHRPAQGMMNDKTFGVKSRRMMVRTAILLAVPSEP